MAHESYPLYIEIAESDLATYTVQWKMPPSTARYIASVTLPSMCLVQGPLAEFAGARGIARRLTYQCEKRLDGEKIVIRYPGPSPSMSTVIRYTAAPGQQRVSVLAPGVTTWIVPYSGGFVRAASQYSALGFVHIWSGVDHLLFVTCLLWVAPGSRRTMMSVSGFTLGHSITLALSSLHIVSLPVPPVEAAIALSIMFLASEILRGPRRTLTWQHPVVVSTSFGLLHGLGFAAALGEIGLPPTEVITALLSFNIGVEVGQMLFIGIALGFFNLLIPLSQRLQHWIHEFLTLRQIVGIVAGSVAAFWLIERCANFPPHHAG